MGRVQAPKMAGSCQVADVVDEQDVWAIRKLFDALQRTHTLLLTARCERWVRDMDGCMKASERCRASCTE